MKSVRVRLISALPLFAMLAALVLGGPGWAQTSSSSPGDSSDRGKAPIPSSPGTPSKPSGTDIGPKAPIMNAPSIMATPERSSAPTGPAAAQVPIRLYGGTYVGPYMPNNPYRDNNPYKTDPFRDNNPFSKSP
jgi:hypothetical protein